MKRKLTGRLAAAALACVLAAALCLPVLADGDDDTVYINSNDDLVAFAQRCSYDVWSKDKTVVLQRDISLGGVDFLPIPSFGGVFDGGGHTISGLNVASGVSPAGLFGVVAETGVVRNLKIEGSVSPSGSGALAGGVAGVNCGVIESCSFSGTVNGEKTVGGIAGENRASGVIRRSSVTGGVFGKNMTGGIAGMNHGTVTGCSNRAYVNTNTLDPSLSLDKLNLSLTGALSTLASPDTYNATVDSGGIAGFSDGSILSCHNYGSVGYQHIGYNVGGIAGRSSGHIATSTNDAHIYGRRDVGGIVGMAEPHVTVDLSQTSLVSVRQALSALSATVDKTMVDAGNSSDAVSARLTAVNNSVSAAESSAQTLSDRLGTAADDAVGEVDRGSAILDNTVDRLTVVTKDLLAVSETTNAALDELVRVNDSISDNGVIREIDAATSDTQSAAVLLKSATDTMNSSLDALKAALAAVPPDAAAVSKSVEQIRGAVTTSRSALERINSALKHTGAAVQGMGDAVEGLDRATRSLDDASSELTTALEDTQSLLGYLSAQEKLQFKPLNAQAESDALYNSLRGVSDNLELLNRETKASSDVLLADVRLINRQFTTLMNTLLDTVEDLEGYSPTAVIEDTSDEDIDAVIAGKVLLCDNTGAVSGDIDVGGVAGSTFIYNALDPENDTDSVASLLRRRYELKCVLQSCSNSGDVSAKRENVGSVCGSATLGVIRGCVAGGTAASESGDYVGGVAGYGDSILRRCWAKCTLTGARYVGGIVGGSRDDGSGLRVEDCRSLVDIPSSSQYAGAISGGESGSFTGNRFVSDTLAGIDRVSYAGKAEPTDYETLAAEDDFPAALRGFTLRFVADDVVIKTVPFRYGESFDASVFPAIPAVAGKFARWDRDTLENLHFDTTVNAVYTAQLTALGSSFTRSASRPAFFVEGAFDDAAAFSAEPAIFAFDTGSEGAWRILRSWRRTIQEQWLLTLPDGEAHTLRYLPPEGVGEALTLYVRDADGRWTRAEHGIMGSYLTFDASGKTVELTVVSASTPWWLWTLLAVFLLVAAALLTELLVRRRGAAAQPEEDPAKRAQAKSKRRKLRIALIAGVAVLGLTVGAAVRLAPRISETMGLYRLVRNYADRSDIDLSVSLSAQLDGKPLAAEMTLCATQSEGKRVSCIQWEDISVWFCDGVMLLENGKTYRAEGVFTDYSQLLTHAATIYRAMDVSVSEENSVKTYHATAQGEDAKRLLSILLPMSTELLPESGQADVDLIVTDGELTSLQFAWRSGEQSVTAELRPLDAADSHTLPTAVRGAIASGSLADAPDISDDFGRLLRAWTEGASRKTLSANAKLRANCGPLLVDESLVWQRSRDYSATLSCLSRRGSTVYYTDSAACTGSGLAISRTDTSYAGMAQLLRLACKALLLGEADCAEISGGWRYTVSLDEDAMAEFSALIAPDAQALGLSATDGTVRLDIRDGSLSALSLRVLGSVRVVRADVPASLSAQLDFDPDAAFPAPSDAVLSALGLTKKSA